MPQIFIFFKLTRPSLIHQRHPGDVASAKRAIERCRDAYARQVHQKGRACFREQSRISILESRALLLKSSLSREESVLRGPNETKDSGSSPVPEMWKHWRDVKKEKKDWAPERERERATRGGAVNVPKAAAPRETLRGARVAASSPLIRKDDSRSRGRAVFPFWARLRRVFLIWGTRFRVRTQSKERAQAEQRCAQCRAPQVRALLSRRWPVARRVSSTTASRGGKNTQGRRFSRAQ